MSSPVHSQKANSITTMFYNIDREVEEMIVSISILTQDSQLISKHLTRWHYLPNCQEAIIISYQGHLKLSEG